MNIPPAFIAADLLSQGGIWGRQPGIAGHLLENW